jgi:hypothetical protein
VIRGEAHTEEARRSRGELAWLLVRRMTVGIGEDGSTEVRITYRFCPPSEAADDFSHGEPDSTSNASTRETSCAPGSWRYHVSLENTTMNFSGQRFSDVRHGTSS